MAINPESTWLLPWRQRPSPSTPPVGLLAQIPTPRRSPAAIFPATLNPILLCSAHGTHFAAHFAAHFQALVCDCIVKCIKSSLSSSAGALSSNSFRAVFQLISDSVQGDSVMATSNRDKQGEKEPATLQRTPEIRETESGNVEVRKDPEHTSKLSKPAEKILDPRDRDGGVATSPHDILAVRRTVDETDTPLE